jgi:hypothetical protein
MTEPIPQQPPQQPPIPEQPEVKPDKTLDTILIIGALTGTCESIDDRSGKVACRHMLEPLENGNADPVEVLADMMISKPAEFDGIVDRFNNLIQKASERAEEKTKIPNAA